MAVEKFLRGTMVVGALIIGGIAVGSQYMDDPEPRAVTAAERSIALNARQAGPADADPDFDLDTPDGEARFALDATDNGDGKVALEFPGGFGLKLPIGKDVDLDSKFEVGGVGTYPGSEMKDMKIRIYDRRGSKRALVTMEFDAPAKPESVADWYAAAFADAGIKVRRSGDRLAGRTPEGKDFALSLKRRGGGSRGVFRVRDTG